MNTNLAFFFLFFPPWWFWESRWTQSPSAVVVLSRNVSVGMLPLFVLSFTQVWKSHLQVEAKWKPVVGQALGGVFPATVADYLEPCGPWFWGTMWHYYYYCGSCCLSFSSHCLDKILGRRQCKGERDCFSSQFRAQSTGPSGPLTWGGGSRSWNSWPHHSHNQKKRAMDAHTLASSPSPLKLFRALTKLRWIFPHQLAWWTTFSTGMLSPRSSWILSLWQPLLTIVGWWQTSSTITGSLAKSLASAIRGQTDLISA